MFIGSPGGLDDERRAAHEVIESVNRSHSERWGCLFKLLGWENAVPGFVRPQTKINEDLDRCDYFIGVLWDKWGSRPSTDPSGYTSGFEEEYERSKERIENGRMKDMAVYFKEVEVPTGMEPGEEIKKVLDFRQKCIDEKEIFFKPFTDVQTFKDVVREKLEELGWRETKNILQENSQVGQSDKTPINQSRSNETQSQDGWLIDKKAQEFLTEITQRPSALECTSAQEIARFRLIATTLSRFGNDDAYLETHDANLIFQHHRKAPLSGQEIQALIDCGVIAFNHQNVPLWNWIAKGELGENPFYHLRILATVGSVSEQKNAIRILELLQQPIPTHDGAFNKNGVLTSWFKEDTENQVFDAAISFLTSNGEFSDISHIEEASLDCSPQRRNKVEGAIVGVLSRTNIDAALKRACENEVNIIESRVVEKLFNSPQSIATDTLSLCLSAKPDDVRLRSAQILSARSEISVDVASTLLTDNNHEIRLVAAEILKKLDHPLDDEILKTVLTAKKQTFGFGLLSGKETDTTFFDRYQTNRLFELSIGELRKKVEDAGIFMDQELSVLYSKFKAATQAEMRENLSDGFQARFAVKIELAKSQLGANDKVIAKSEELGSFIRPMLCSNTLAALCELKKYSDLALVRRTVDQYKIDASEAVLSYLARFGDWQDIERIKKLGGHPSDRSVLLSINRTQLPLQKADAIFALGKQRIADLLDLDMDITVRNFLLKRLPNKVFKDLSNDIILRELEQKEEETRIIFALRCVQSLTKSRITSLLNQYADDNGHRFYNSVHWLDLGASMPSRIAKTVAVRELESRG